jgi:ketosteroid isomerase-like protein
MLRPVRRPFVAVLAISGAFAGCGQGPSDIDQVHDVVEAFGKASAAKDYQRLCDELLAPKLVSDVESAGLPCEAALKQGLGSVSAPKLTIGEIKVSGDSATADVQSSARGEKPSRDTLQLVRVNDSWRIASLK